MGLVWTLMNNDAFWPADTDLVQVTTTDASVTGAADLASHINVDFNMVGLPYTLASLGTASYRLSIYAFTQAPSAAPVAAPSVPTATPTAAPTRPWHPVDSGTRCSGCPVPPLWWSPAGRS